MYGPEERMEDQRRANSPESSQPLGSPSARNEPLALQVIQEGIEVGLDLLGSDGKLFADPRHGCYVAMRKEFPQHRGADGRDGIELPSEIEEPGRPVLDLDKDDVGP